MMAAEPGVEQIWHGFWLVVWPDRLSASHILRLKCMLWVSSHGPARRILDDHVPTDEFGSTVLHR